MDRGIPILRVRMDIVRSIGPLAEWLGSVVVAGGVEVST
jgi:hypothetical protein